MYIKYTTVTTANLEETLEYHADEGDKLCTFCNYIEGEEKSLLVVQFLDNEAYILGEVAGGGFPDGTKGSDRFIGTVFTPPVRVTPEPASEALEGLTDASEAYYDIDQWAMFETDRTPYRSSSDASFLIAWISEYQKYNIPFNYDRIRMTDEGKWAL